jgi:hypothetical protein
MPISPDGFYGIGGTATPQNFAYPAIHQMIVQTARPAQKLRGMLLDVPANGKFALTVAEQDGNKDAEVDELAEAQIIAIDHTPYKTPDTIKLVEIGQGHRITQREMLFAQIPIIPQKLADQGMKMGNKMDRHVAGVVYDALHGATNAVSCKGKSLLNGGEVTKANTIGDYDINDGISYIEEENFIPDKLYVNPAGHAFLKELPNYSAQYYAGNPGFRTGVVETVQGLQVIMSKNVPKNTGWIIASGTNPTDLGQYSPFGMFYHEGEIMTAIDQQPEARAYYVYSNAYIRAHVTNELAGAELDYS